eukprot:gene41095-55560_t
MPASGTGGLAAKARAPRKPFSSASRNTIQTSCFGGLALNASATASAPATPAAWHMAQVLPNTPLPTSFSATAGAAGAAAGADRLADVRREMAPGVPAAQRLALRPQRLQAQRDQAVGQSSAHKDDVGAGCGGRDHAPEIARRPAKASARGLCPSDASDCAWAGERVGASEATIIDGKAFSERLRAQVAAEVATLKADHGVTPGLAVVLVGEDPASEVYVRNKGVQTEAAGMYSETHKLPGDVSEADLLALVERLNADPAIHGVLVQFPVPDHLSQARIVAAISPDKDVDGLTVTNAGRLASGLPALTSCPPAGSMLLLQDPLGDLR